LSEPFWKGELIDGPSVSGAYIAGAETTGVGIWSGAVIPEERGRGGVLDVVELVAF
jgi:hypothetical protein